MTNGNRSDTCAYRKVRRLANTRPAHVDGEPPEPDLCKWVWGTEHRDQGWKDQVLSGNLFNSNTTKGGL